HVPVQFNKNTTSEFIFGYDFKHTNNFLTFLKSEVFNNFIDISQFVFEFSKNGYDKFGISSCLFSIYASPGGMTKHNHNIDFRQEGYARGATYFYATLHLDRTINIYKDFLYALEFFAQASTNKLLPTEEISIGGFYTVRGYQENAVYGDYGFYARNEFRSPKICYPKNYKHYFQFIAFADVGFVSKVNDNVSDKNTSTLASVGPALRYVAHDSLILKLDYGVQLKKANRVFFAKSWHSRLHAYVSLQY
ncbi:hypothetical protein LCGC14_2572220, partial [marine sediment metagenome]